MSDPVRRASAAVTIVFWSAGWIFAGWAARLPAVRDGLTLQPNQVGFLLLLGSLGSVLALPVSGLVVRRFGAIRTIGTGVVVAATALSVAGFAVQESHLGLVAVMLPLVGAGIAIWDAAMNVEGAKVEQALGRSVMPRYHAGFSLGTVVGAGLGAGAASFGVPIAVHLVITSWSAVAAVYVVLRWLPNDEPGPDRVSRTATAWTEPRTLAIGVVVLGVSLTEGAANDWVSLAVVDGFQMPHAVGAASFGLFVTAMTLVRVFGAGLVDRWGRVAVLRIGAVVAAAGLVVFAFGPLWLALVGVVLWGAGAALGFPIGMSAAADDPVHAAPRVAVVATIGYTAFLVGPPLLGTIAAHIGYRMALLVVAGPVLVGVIFAKASSRIPTDPPRLDV